MNDNTETKQRIIEKSSRLFLQYGIRSVSMDEIASNAGVSKKTIYQYFKDKNSLVEQVVDEILNIEITTCENGKSAKKNVVEEGFAGIEKISNFFNNLNPTILFDLKKYHPSAYEKFLNYKDSYMYKTMKSTILWGIQDGLFREDINIDIIARFRVESILITLLPEFHLDKYSLTEIHKEFFYLFLYGMSTKKGYELINRYRNKEQKKKTDATV